ncbi:hypothetical protein [uncultured Methanobrevibacter sp.]|uniref:hypothetical protein n=1 Tax=uncultured Methanobrevibacter sp. TaxID=253161 RepID=UPI0025F1B6B0|nr:hypothetical protein [uncultured Methanobrevibacter sp.]
MHILEKAFITLLRNHLPIHNKYIFTGSRYIASDNTPCVSVQVADESYIRKHYVELDHVQHLRRLYNADVWVNIWCNTEEERTSLIDAIELRFNQLEASHYTTCSNFNDDWCSKLDSECEVLTSDTGRANKGQCPNLENFTSFFETFNISQRTFYVNSMTDLDERDESEPVLRTIFKLNMQYYKFYPIGGRLFDDINFNEDLL